MTRSEQVARDPRYKDWEAAYREDVYGRLTNRARVTPKASSKDYDVEKGE